MNPLNSTQTRLDYLDATRAFALLLGVVFHASLSFMPMFIGWAVMDINTSEWVPYFVLVSHSFRMEVFFVIAGFFAHMKFHQGDGISFLRSRLFRLALPFALAWLLLRPLLVSGWILGAQSMRGSVEVLQAFIQAFSDFEALMASLFVGTHLWFLYYLLIITLTCLLLRSALAKLNIIEKLAGFADRITAWISQSQVSLIFLAALTACCMWFMSSWSVDTPDKSLVPNVAVFLLYGGFFVFGWLLHRQVHLLESFTELTWFKALACLVAIISTGKLSGYEMSFAHPQYAWIKAVYLLSYGLMMWLLVALFLGVCRHFFSQANSRIRYLADASYWIYLVHLPFVVWLQVAVAEVPIHWLAKLLVVCTVTILISIVLYDLVVRATPIGKLLNGKTKARVWFTRKPSADLTRAA